MSANDDFERGSEWRQWDLHIHSPASFHWSGKRFDPDPNSPLNSTLVDEMIRALNSSKPAVFALMDYWTFDGWFALKKRLAEPGAPKLLKKVFPGIELRLAAPTTCRLNAHVLFSDEVEDQVLYDFKSALQVEIVARPLSNNSLIQLARTVGADILGRHGIKKPDVDNDSEIALHAGCKIAELNCDSYKDAIAKTPNNCALGFMPYDTSDGLAEVKWHEHYAYFLGLFKTSPIFESRSQELRNCFVGERTTANLSFFDDFQTGLGKIPRLVVSGSDAHRFLGTPKDNDKRGYGDYPSEKITWIKADPTWRGLLQAIKEPAKRSFIGPQPPKLIEVAQNKTFYIDCVEVNRDGGAVTTDTWLDGCCLPLNFDLVAIIGNKGSGKSALADIIALLGNSRQHQHFSFLKKDRFRGKSGEPAKHFVGKLRWLDSSEREEKLSENPSEDKVELVRYIPQGYFENLCNSHVTRSSSAFEQELRAVIFSHTSDALRLGALDFDQLIAQQEGNFRDQLAESRKELKRLNQEISLIEDQLQPEIKRSLKELAALKSKQIDEHKKMKPIVVDKPADELTPEQAESAQALEVIASELQTIDRETATAASNEAQHAAKLKAVHNARERVRLLNRQHKQFLDDTQKDFQLLALDAATVAELKINTRPLDDIADQIAEQQKIEAATATERATRRRALVEKQAMLNTKLNEPQLHYQQYQSNLHAWNEKLRELTGTSDAPDSLEGINARIKQLEDLPAALAENEKHRLKITEEIFDILDEQRNAREQLFQPVQELIQNNALIRDDYKLRFQATLGGSPDVFSSALFELIKQNAGEFRGVDESHAAIRRTFEPCDLNAKDGVLNLVAELHQKIRVAVSPSKSILTLLKKDKSAVEVYDLIFGLSFLEPRYTLLFQDTPIEQLSPGQRGALLLIFYLLVDKGHNPIVLDQPEENLDNETVVGLLVPVVTEAKKRRQIIMVTHNPNLAVVCDAEQIVYSSFDRKAGHRITYQAGAIENPKTNLHAVNVLEGTMRAFNNREGKYHK